MTFFIEVHIVLLASLCCVKMQMLRYSYFTISSKEDLNEEEDFTIATQVHDEFSCASICSSTVMCRYALFDKDSKKCSFVKATETLVESVTGFPNVHQCNIKTLILLWPVTAL